MTDRMSDAERQGAYGFVSGEIYSTPDHDMVHRTDTIKGARERRIKMLENMVRDLQKSRRDQAAFAALQGLLANTDIGMLSPNQYASDALLYADALLAALDAKGGAE